MTRTQIATADFSCGGMQKGTNGDGSWLLQQEQTLIHNLLFDYQMLTHPKKATNSQTLTENFQGWYPCLCKGMINKNTTFLYYYLPCMPSYTMCK